MELKIGTNGEEDCPQGWFQTEENDWNDRLSHLALTTSGIAEYRTSVVTDLQIDRELLHEAHRLGACDTHKDTVDKALRLFIRLQKKLEVLDFEGAFPEFDDYDYKAIRNRD